MSALIPKTDLWSSQLRHLERLATSTQARPHVPRGHLQAILAHLADLEIERAMAVDGQTRAIAKAHCTTWRLAALWTATVIAAALGGYLV